MVPNSADLALEVFKAAIRAVEPERLIEGAVEMRGNKLWIGKQRVALHPRGKLYVIGAGKASGALARALEPRLGDRVTGGQVVVKYGHSEPCRRVKVVEAAHPYPDEAGIKATASIVEICRGAGEEDLILCLLSGGGSALLSDCPAGSDLDEWIAFSKRLVNSGAAIGEINAVRKHLSFVKGGQLARIAWPARVVSLVLSDVVGDPLDVIASGPTVADPTTFGEALAVLEKYKLAGETPEPILEQLQRGAQGLLPETPKPGESCLSRSRNVVIGNNRMALAAAAKEACNRGVETSIVTDSLQGDVGSAAEWIVEMARKQAGQHRGDKAGCLIFGGEPTLEVKGKGKGGRCQHLALQAAALVRNQRNITVLAAGTDGSDGPTDAAGAWVDGGTWDKALSAGLEPGGFLERFDSYSFFERLGGHVITGPTRTNVMDIVIAICL